MGSSVCEPEFKVIIFLPCKICGNEKYAVAVDYQILDQKLTGPPVTTDAISNLEEKNSQIVD